MTGLGAPTTATASGVGPRTYGNWRKPSSPGLPRLGLLGTAAALASLASKRARIFVSFSGIAQPK